MAPSAAAPIAVSAAAPAGTLQLPVLVFGVVEVRRLGRELEALEEFMRQTELREPGKQGALPRVSRLLDALAGENHLNLLQAADRKQLEDFLQHIQHTAPTIHVSFAADPSSAFTAQVVTWLRANVAPDILLEVGLQPTIAAGCIVRTTNKIFDMSLRESFADAGGLLLESLRKAEDAVPVGAPVADAAAAVTAMPVMPAATVAPAQPAATVPPSAVAPPQPAGVAT